MNSELPQVRHGVDHQVLVFSDAYTEENRTNDIFWVERVYTPEEVTNWQDRFRVRAEDGTVLVDWCLTREFSSRSGHAVRDLRAPFAWVPKQRLTVETSFGSGLRFILEGRSVVVVK